MKQLKKSSADVPTDGNTTKGSPNQEENCFHVNSLFDFNPNLISSQTTSLFYIHAISDKLPSSYLQDIFHPPQA